MMLCCRPSVPRASWRWLALAGIAAGSGVAAQDTSHAEVSRAGTVTFAAQIATVPEDHGVSTERPAITIERPQGRLVVGADKVEGRPIYGPSSIAGGGMPSALPLARARLTSAFGYRQHPIHGGSRMHSGIDLAAPYGTPVQATADGMVTSAGWQGGYGILISVRHGGGVQTRYAHLSAIAVRPGTSVKAGQIIGYVGSTGNTTGPHLHYELRVNGRAVNPVGG